jgi:hypothetical protein
MASFDELMAKFESSSTAAREATDKRLAQATAIYDEIIRRYQPGGVFEERGLAQLGKQKTADVGGEMQQLISSGLYGTTTTAGVGRRWEESVGEPARMTLEDVMMQRLSQAQVGKAGLLERVEDVGPDPDLYARLMAQAASGPTYSIPRETGGPTGYGGRTPHQYLPWLQAGFEGMGGGPVADAAPSQPTQAAGGQPTGVVGEQQKVQSTGGTAAVATTGEGRTIKIASKTSKGKPLAGAQIKTIHVPEEATGTYAGGFANVQAYLKYIPSGWAIIK